MRLYPIAYLFPLILPVTALGAISESEYTAQKEGLANWRRIAMEAQAMPRDEAITTLSLGVRKTSMKIIYSIDGTDDVRNELLHALLAIPGHATYWGDQIDETRKLVLAHGRLSTEEQDVLTGKGVYKVLGEYESIRRKAFENLALMPSSEAVGVLGHFVNDPEGLDGNDMFGNFRGGGDVMPYPSNARVACLGLASLPIANPPASVGQEWVRRGGGAPDEDLASWKTWWNQIASGKRTYRFKGDPTEYGPDGPATPELLDRIRKMNERDAMRDNHHTGAVTDRSGLSIPPGAATGSSSRRQISGPPIAGILAAAASILAALGWFFIRRKNRG